MCHGLINIVYWKLQRNQWAESATQDKDHQSLGVCFPISSSYLQMHQQNETIILVKFAGVDHWDGAE